MLSICRQIFSSWNDNNIKYCHWKSNEHLEDGLNGETDLDLFIQPEDQTKACNELRRLDVIQCKPLKSNKYPNVEEWIGFDNETGKLIHLHIHYSIITGRKYCKEFVFPLDDVIIKNRILLAPYNVYVASPEVELVILYSRVCLKAANPNHIKIDGDYLKEIQYLKKHYRAELLNSICAEIKGCEQLSSYILKEELDAQDWSEVNKIVRKWLSSTKRFGSLTSILRSNYYEIKNKAVLGCNKYLSTNFLCRKTLGAPGTVICFIGQDGSGKSTLTTEICKWLNWKIEAKRFYLGSGDHYHSVFKSIQESTGAKIKKESKENDVVGNKSLGKRVLSWVSMILSSLNLVHISRRAYKIVKAARSYVRRGGIALFDRYPQDQFEGVYDGPKIATSYIDKGRSNWFVRWCYKKEKRNITKAQSVHPNVIFKLNLSVEESLRRKPEEDFENLTMKHEITERLQFPESQVYVIDATQDYDMELLEVKNILWKTIVQSR